MRTRARETAPEARGDRELVFAARAGDERAFDALFVRYRDGLYRLAFAITHDPSASEEIAVDTFARAYRSLERLDPQGSLRPWLYRVAVNLSYNRKPRKIDLTSSFEDAAGDRALLENEARSPAALAEIAEVRRTVLAAVDTLSTKHRLVVVLHYLEGLSLAEVAEIAECPVGTVKSRLHYALKRLRTRLSLHSSRLFEPARDLARSGRKMSAPVREVRE